MIRYLRLAACVFLAEMIAVPAWPQSVSEGRFVPIGGIEQWITIHGADRSKPIVLFLHGGPGSVLTPYAKAIFNGWEKDFVLVNWDQRGAGRTFGRNAPDDPNEDYWIGTPLTLDKIVEDGIEVARYLLKQSDQQKVILVGTSWGSAVGAKMALKNPELFHAYIGHAQIVNFAETLRHAYKITLGLALDARDTTSADLLTSLGAPPYRDARHLGQLLRAVKKYEARNAVPAPADWWKPAPEYDNEADSKHRYHGDDYSFIYLAGHEQLGIMPMINDLDLMKDGRVFDIPVLLVQGEQDILTTRNISRAYFDALKAPDKKYFLVRGAAHGFNREIVDHLFQILKGLAIPEGDGKTTRRR